MELIKVLMTIAGFYIFWRFIRILNLCEKSFSYYLEFTCDKNKTKMIKETVLDWLKFAGNIVQLVFFSIIYGLTVVLVKTVKIVDKGIYEIRLFLE